MKLNKRQVRELAERMYLRQARSTNRFMAQMENRREHKPVPFAEISPQERRAWDTGASEYLGEAVKLGWRAPT